MDRMLRLGMWPSSWTTCVRPTGPWVQSLALKSKCWRTRLAKLMAGMLSVRNQEHRTAGLTEKMPGSQQVCGLLRSQDWENFSKHSLLSSLPPPLNSALESRGRQIWVSPRSTEATKYQAPGLTAETLSKAKQPDSHSFPPCTGWQQKSCVLHATVSRTIQFVQQLTIGGWRDGCVAKSTCCSSEGLGSVPNDLRLHLQGTQAGSSAFFSPLRARAVQWYTHIHTDRQDNHIHTTK